MLHSAKAAPQPHNLREFERHQLVLPGKMFVPGDQSETICTIVDLSAGGAGVHCSDPPPLEAFVILYIDGFGRFEAVTMRMQEMVLGLRFLCSERKRERLLEKLTIYLNEGFAAATRVRQHARLALGPKLNVLRASGQEMRCEILDISLEGVSLKTSARPPIHEVIRIGRSYARVVRHHDNGIGVEFSRPEPAAQGS